MLDFDSAGALLRTALPLPLRRGKVRDVYDLGETLAIVSTDRISAFDYVLPVGIPDKGRILTSLSRFWFDFLSVPHHLLSLEVPAELAVDAAAAKALAGRTMVVRKAEVVPFECVVRGYLEGSGLREYQQSQSVCGIGLPTGLRQCDALPEPIFTPATKAEEGHDENVSFETMVAAVGTATAERLRELSLRIYREAAERAAAAGLIIADTKFEFGFEGDRLILVDEVLTPDSSRFWPADSYAPGRSQPSYDKQFVREWLMHQSGWDRNSPPPPLPAEIVAKTREKYLEAHHRITGEEVLSTEH
ncbi:phosphoribosylaminoimidazolesuccinocarboxamide synthase [Candidatus Laterigemmans baculatus]|uniref:phosphoribosylaminoimidazolesuccinocarboxamide synthase n=1 Tax=Candidatus Laterigemmans baculatus TaxID=2770505 RepID=UPI001F46531E|nr:phosphoribosylaminoimidazolesuccinocarboxamide synthase [Candidatus Laterigemmans baculatus]